jgi:hypothetical protein
MTDLPVQHEEPEETVDGVAVVPADVRALDPVAPRPPLPAVKAAAVAATGFAAGVATVIAIHRRQVRRLPARRRGGRRRGRDGELLTIVGTRSVLLDIHLLGRE